AGSGLALGRDPERSQRDGPRTPADPLRDGNLSSSPGEAGRRGPAVGTGHAAHGREWPGGGLGASGTSSDQYSTCHPSGMFRAGLARGGSSFGVPQYDGGRERSGTDLGVRLRGLSNSGGRGIVSALGPPLSEVGRPRERARIDRPSRRRLGAGLSGAG